MLLILGGCQTTTNVNGCVNSVSLGFGVFQVNDLTCTHDSDFQRGTSISESRARNDDYNSFNKVQAIIHPNKFWRLKPIKEYDFKAGFYYVKLSAHCFTARVQNEVTITYNKVCKNNYKPFTQNEAREMIDKRFLFASYNSNSAKSSSSSSNQNNENCKMLGFKKGTASFKKCLRNLSK